MLLEQSGERELAVLNDYLVACRRNRGPVLAVGDDMLMMNDRARELLDPADQEPLLAEASEALAEGRRHPLVIDLPSGQTVRVHCRPTVSGRGIVGGVLQVQSISSMPAPDPWSVAGSLRAPPSGSGAAWTKCCAAVDRHLHAGEWLVLEGEPGAGRETVARAAHQARTPAARVRVMPAEGAGPEWVADVAEELALSGGTVILTDVDRLPGDAADRAGGCARALPRVRRRRPPLRLRHRATAGRRTPPRARPAAVLLPADGRRPAVAPPRGGRGRTRARTCSPASDTAAR